MAAGRLSQSLAFLHQGNNKTRLHYNVEACLCCRCISKTFVYGCWQTMSIKQRKGSLRIQQVYVRIRSFVIHSLYCAKAMQYPYTSYSITCLLFPSPSSPAYVPAYGVPLHCRPSTTHTVAALHCFAVLRAWRDNRRSFVLL